MQMEIICYIDLINHKLCIIQNKTKQQKKNKTKITDEHYYSKKRLDKGNLIQYLNDDQLSF